MSSFKPWQKTDAISRVSAGALVLTSDEEMTERGRPTDQGINDLARDIHNTLVYCNGNDNRIAADKLLTEAEAVEKFLPAAAKLMRTRANVLLQEADECDIRAKGRDPEQIKREISFSDSFFKFRDNWDKFYASVKDGSAFDSMSGNGVSDAIDSYDAQYRTYLKGYSDLGYKTSAPPPPKSNAGDTVGPIIKDVKDATKGLFDTIPWGTVAIVAAVGVGGFIVYKLVSSSKNDATVTVQPAST